MLRRVRGGNFEVGAVRIRGCIVDNGLVNNWQQALTAGRSRILAMLDSSKGREQQSESRCVGTRRTRCAQRGEWALVK